MAATTGSLSSVSPISSTDRTNSWSDYFVDNSHGYLETMISPTVPSILCALLMLSGSVIAHADSQEAYDTPPVRKASEILPANLITGEHFRVLDEVTWNDGLHEFTVETEFGTFSVWGEPMLRVRLAEVNSWVALEHTSSVDVSADAVVRSALGSVSTLANAFAHPIMTLEGIPTGVGRMFLKVEHTAESIGETITGDDESDSGELSIDEGSAAAKLGRSLIGVNRAYRRLAEEYDVNPYTTNEAIRKVLLRLAKVDAMVSTGTKIFVPSVGVRLGIAAKVAKAIYSESWLEIVASNENILVEMGASPDQIKALFNNDAINLTLLALMIQTVDEMDQVEGRLNVIDQLILLETDAEAVYFAECLLMADLYNENESPLTAMLPGTLIPVALTRDRKLIAFSAVDYAYWTKDWAVIVGDFTDMYGKYSPQREFWIADQVSPRFIEGAGAKGWIVRSGLRHSVLPVVVPWGLGDD